jgi:hypothetical protein
MSLNLQGAISNSFLYIQLIFKFKLLHSGPSHYDYIWGLITPVYISKHDVLDKVDTMDNVQERNNCANNPHKILDHMFNNTVQCD